MVMQQVTTRSCMNAEHLTGRKVYTCREGDFSRYTSFPAAKSIQRHLSMPVVRRGDQHCIDISSLLVLAVHRTSGLADHWRSSSRQRTERCNCRVSVMANHLLWTASPC